MIKMAVRATKVFRFGPIDHQKLLAAQNMKAETFGQKLRRLAAARVARLALMAEQVEARQRGMEAALRKKNNKAEQVLLEQLARTEEEKAAKLKEATKNRTAIKAKREEIDHSLFKAKVDALSPKTRAGMGLGGGEDEGMSMALE